MTTHGFLQILNYFSHYNLTFITGVFTGARLAVGPGDGSEGRENTFTGVELLVEELLQFGGHLHQVGCGGAGNHQMQLVPR